MLSNHDVVRHATRYALPEGTDLDAWLTSDGADPRPDEERGRRRARAATLLTLALPGSAYLYQGEELGLPEVADLPADVLQDPTFLRSGGEQKGRDGCRVPLPWAAHGPTLGFGDQLAHLPVPADFGRFAVERQEADEASTLSFYRRALAERRRLQTGETLEWLTPTHPTVVAFRRPGGWASVTNFGSSPAPMPAGSVIVSSAPAEGRRGARGDDRLAPAGPRARRLTNTVRRRGTLRPGDFDQRRRRHDVHRHPSCRHSWADATSCAASGSRARASLSRRAPAAQAAPGPPRSSSTSRSPR